MVLCDYCACFFSLHSQPPTLMHIEIYGLTPYRKKIVHRIMHNTMMAGWMARTKRQKGVLRADGPCWTRSSALATRQLINGSGSELSDLHTRTQHIVHHFSQVDVVCAVSFGTFLMMMKHLRMICLLVVGSHVLLCFACM